MFNPSNQQSLGSLSAVELYCAWPNCKATCFFMLRKRKSLMVDNLHAQSRWWHECVLLLIFKNWIFYPHKNTLKFQSTRKTKSYATTILFKCLGCHVIIIIVTIYDWKLKHFSKVILFQNRQGGGRVIVWWVYWQMFVENILARKTLEIQNSVLKCVVLLWQSSLWVNRSEWIITVRYVS